MESAQNTSKDLILKQLQSDGVLLGGDQTAPVVGHKFSLAQPVRIVESENNVVGIIGRW
jgi:hypothetical protein